MHYLLALLLLPGPALATAADWAAGTELAGIELSAFAKPRPGKAKKNPRRDCVPAGGSCWGGFAGAECCSHACSWSIPIYYGYCY